MTGTGNGRNMRTRRSSTIRSFRTPISASIARSPAQRAATANGRMQPVTVSAPVSPSAEMTNGIASEPSANASENTASVKASTRASV